MIDRLLHGLLWLTIIGLITGVSGISLFLGYGGVLHLISGRFPDGTAFLSMSLLLGAGAFTLSRHGNELIDR